MAPGSGLIERLHELTGLFNRKSMDLPDGLFDRKTQFLLNGAAFESLLGRSPADPLVLMLARGPAGYRFAAKAVQHALPDALLEHGAFVEAGTGTISGECWLSGHLRGTGAAFNAVFQVEIQAAPTGRAETVSVVMADAPLTALDAARHLPG